jgi:Trypsin
MRRFFHLAWLVAALALVGLALALPQAGAVVGGTADFTHRSVGIMYADDRPFSGGFCTGSLIAPHEFLTAGHCAIGLALNPARAPHVKVSFDQAVSLTPEFAITSEHPVSVTGAIVQPGFSCPGSTCLNDVGLFHLAQDVTDVTPVELPPVGFLDQRQDAGELRGHTFTLSGYGINGTDRAFTSPNANLIWDMQREYGPAQFLALSPDFLRDFSGGCAGDSGAPFFYSGAFPNLVVAVGSTGPPSCVGPGAEQRLDTQSVHDFLAPFTQ